MKKESRENIAGEAPPPASSHLASALRSVSHTLGTQAATSQPFQPTDDAQPSCQSHMKLVPVTSALPVSSDPSGVTSSCSLPSSPPSDGESQIWGGSTPTGSSGLQVYQLHAVRSTAPPLGTCRARGDMDGEKNKGLPNYSTSKVCVLSSWCTLLSTLPLSIAKICRETPSSHCDHTSAL